MAGAAYGPEEGPCCRRILQLLVGDDGPLPLELRINIPTLSPPSCTPPPPHDPSSFTYPCPHVSRSPVGSRLVTQG